VRAAPPPLPRDPEFDHPPRPGVRRPPPEVVGFHQRLLVNPFLTLLATMLMLLAGQALARSRWAGHVPLLAILGTVVAGLVLQYHCLDCGATGSYLRWRRHACPRVVDRWLTPGSAASHFFPMPGTQVVLWLLGLVVLAGFWALSRL
jgi:hypothetical protein